MHLEMTFHLKFEDFCDDCLIRYRDGMIFLSCENGIGQKFILFQIFRCDKNHNFFFIVSYLISKFKKYYFIFTL